MDSLLCIRPAAACGGTADRPSGLQLPYIARSGQAAEPFALSFSEPPVTHSRFRPVACEGRRTALRRRRLRAGRWHEDPTIRTLGFKPRHRASAKSAWRGLPLTRGLSRRAPLGGPLPYLGLRRSPLAAKPPRRKPGDSRESRYSPTASFLSNGSPFDKKHYPHRPVTPRRNRPRNTRRGNPLGFPRRVYLNDRRETRNYSSPEPNTTIPPGSDTAGVAPSDALSRSAPSQEDAARFSCRLSPRFSCLTARLNRAAARQRR